MLCAKINQLCLLLVQFILVIVVVMVTGMLMIVIKEEFLCFGFNIVVCSCIHDGFVISSTNLPYYSFVASQRECA